MGTRAIIRAWNEEESWSLYCHYDGYPKVLGKLVTDFVELSPKIDPNSEYYSRPEDYSPYTFVPNVSLEPSKFIASLAGYLWSQGYTSAYMTNRNPKEEKETDIEWLYEITFKENRPFLQVFEGKSGNFIPIEELANEV